MSKNEREIQKSASIVLAPPVHSACQPPRRDDRARRRQLSLWPERRVAANPIKLGIATDLTGAISWPGSECQCR